jgi:hypothetical protein
MSALVVAAACLAVLGIGWATGADALRDPGGYRETARSWWAEIRHRGHAQWHVIGAALTCVIGHVPGRFSGFDLLADAIGVAIVVAALRLVGR